jgi:hypothetical protein
MPWSSTGTPASTPPCDQQLSQQAQALLDAIGDEHAAGVGGNAACGANMADDGLAQRQQALRVPVLAQLVRLAVQRPCKQHAPAAQRKQPGVRSANPEVQPHLARMRARDMVWLPVLRRAQARLRPVHAGVLPRR